MTKPEAIHRDLTSASIWAAVVCIQSKWPSETRSRGDGSSVYFYFPSLFIGAFPGICTERVLPLFVFCRMYAESIFWQDKIIDQTPNVESTATSSLKIALLQAESHRILHRLFPPSTLFWERFHEYLIEHTEALILEQHFVVGGRPFAEYTDDVHRRIVQGKNGLARSVVAGLVELSGDERKYDHLIAVVNNFNMATQLWDDLEDWKTDAKAGVPTSVVSRLMDGPKKDLNDVQWRAVVARLSRELYYRGHAQAVLSRILTCLDAAERNAPDCPALGLYEKTAILRRRCIRIQADIERIVGENLALTGACLEPKQGRV